MISMEGEKTANKERAASGQDAADKRSVLDKLHKVFGDMIVHKDQTSSFFKDISVPSFLRDWLLRKFEDDRGNFDQSEVTAFVKEYLPGLKEWPRIKDRIIDGERVKLLTRIRSDIDIKTQTATFTLPDYGLQHKETTITSRVWDNVKDDLLSAREKWGVVELGLYTDEKGNGLVELRDFKNFCPYTVELDYYKDARGEFNIDEWIDVLLAAVDYNAAAYSSTDQKLATLSRLLPFVEKRLNLIELAPKGTGKSYLFGRISRYGMLVDGGRITRAKMFYDNSRCIPGYITGSDYVAIDEVKLVRFSDMDEMRSILQGYMESGTFNANGYEGQSDAGIVFLGNIDHDRMDEHENMFSELPKLFQESALLDRIHGFIKGWDIPRMNEDMKMTGWALNSEYFTSIMHLLRDDLSYRASADALIDVPAGADTRHTEAVKRIATGWLKLLFPNVRGKDGIRSADFYRYCLMPAVRMRDIILSQLRILDGKEYGSEKHNMPNYCVRG